MENHKPAQLGEQLMAGESSPSDTLDTEKACFLKHKLKLGQSGYQVLKDPLETEMLPTWKMFHNFEKNVLSNSDLLEQLD